MATYLVRVQGTTDLGPAEPRTYTLTAGNERAAARAGVDGYIGLLAAGPDAERALTVEVFDLDHILLFEKPLGELVTARVAA